MTATTPTKTTLDANKRHRMIEIAAYFLSERRGFAPGQAEHDWLLAEEQIDQMLERLRQDGQPADSLHEIDIRNALRLWSNQARATTQGRPAMPALERRA